MDGDLDYVPHTLRELSLPLLPLQTRTCFLPEGREQT